MPVVTIAESPLAPGTSPVRIYYREHGQGVPLIFLHSGWGYQVYHFEKQISAFADRFRILIPERTGYGRSQRVTEMPTDFHRRAAIEMRGFLDALGVGRAVLWGHSDGAVIAAIMALSEPSRYLGLILEALHYDREKPNSREFFRTMVMRPELLGERVCQTLAREQGEDYWREMLAQGGRVWLKIAEESIYPEKDFFGGRLSEISVPTILIHGRRDPRTEPGELETVSQLLPHVSVHYIEEAGHSPHSSENSALECNRVAGAFLRQFVDEVRTSGGNNLDFNSNSE
jgi:pimeloyl-ACP methyl ester carboxylesterase